MGQWLDFKRCMVVFGRSGNPDGIHLQTVGIPKAVANRTVPNIVGLTYANAQQNLTALQLSMSATGNIAVGNVVSQSPVAGAVVPKTYSVIANFAVVQSQSFSNGFQQIGFF
jgi:beta-lactam-binding protein with PASTA domain